ncbi:MAG: hypothetical protein J7641_12410 [Cyanobacteria bacterium SID2]|nr:hypothetical protein [Cyanobacteria bacterium SID2]MBP0003204.1 hypothetical protein [Cyanobacteria bacterium SBC]
MTEKLLTICSVTIDGSLAVGVFPQFEAEMAFCPAALAGYFPESGDDYR